MSGVNRLPAPSGLLVDHEKKIEFAFEGHRYEGQAGFKVFAQPDRILF